MRKYTKLTRITSLLLCACALLVFSACNNETPGTDSTSAPEVSDTLPPDDGNKLSGLEFTLSGDARIENGVLLSDKSSNNNTALYEGLDIASACVDITLQVNASTTGGISFRYRNDQHRYFIAFDRNKSSIRLVEHNGDDTVILENAHCEMTPGKDINIRIAYNYTILKIYVGDVTEDRFPDIEIKLDNSRGSGLLLDCGRGSITYSSVKISEYPYVLDEKDRYVNPVTTGADPYILQWDGKYYIYSTNAPMQGYKVSVSEDLVKWTDKGLCLKTGDVHGTPTSSEGFWAPEVYEIDGKFYMVYTVAGHIGVAVADSPLGPFKKYSDGFIFDYKSIDGHLFFDDDGQTYIYYVKVVSGKGNEVYGAKIDLKTLKTENETKLIAPENGTWEWREGYVAEGPSMLKHNGTYYLTYSCNGYTSQHYAVGYATCSTPLGNFEKYENNPILAQSPGNDCYGPGHHSFTTSPGGETLIVYHRHASATTIHNRTTCIDRYAFVKVEGEPIDRLVVYGPTSTPQKKPQ